MPIIIIYRSDYTRLTDSNYMDAYYAPDNQAVFLVPMSYVYFERYRLIMPIFKTW